MIEKNKEHILLWSGIVGWLILLLNLFVFAALTPGYSHITNMVSDLGRIEAPYHKINNTVFIFYGLLFFPAGLGFYYSVKRFTVRNNLAITIGILVAMIGSSFILAGLYPLPDPRHFGYGISAVQIIIPFLFAWAFWKTQGARSFALFHLVSFIIIVVMTLIFIIAGAGSHGNINIPNGGLFQRINIFVVFIWYMITYYWLMTCKL